ncbi:hypothetical protein [Helicobacter suis]|uniref:hypothetical protein n=1 Tax=Helicobacter suis TaxID=104628 RepID=UPI0013D5ECBB|nr:hypothetical protein [Helicobacter suis]
MDIHDPKNPNNPAYYVDKCTVAGLTKCGLDSIYSMKYGALPEVHLQQMQRDMKTVYNNQVHTAKTVQRLSQQVKDLQRKIRNFTKPYITSALPEMKEENRRLAKFPLLCDGQRVTSLEQLREHFNLLDVLEHYKTGHLQRWLKSRGLTSQLEKIGAIKTSQDVEILSALCLVFEIEADKQMIQEVLESHKNITE